MNGPCMCERCVRQRRIDWWFNLAANLFVAALLVALIGLPILLAIEGILLATRP